MYPPAEYYGVPVIENPEYEPEEIELPELDDLIIIPAEFESLKTHLRIEEGDLEEWWSVL